MAFNSHYFPISLPPPSLFLVFPCRSFFFLLIAQNISLFYHYFSFFFLVNRFLVLAPCSPIDLVLSFSCFRVCIHFIYCLFTSSFDLLKVWSYSTSLRLSDNLHGYFFPLLLSLAFLHLPPLYKSSDNDICHLYGIAEITLPNFLPDFNIKATTLIILLTRSSFVIL